VARIPETELARLKVEVSVQRLAEGCGVELRRQGQRPGRLLPVPRGRLAVAGGHAGQKSVALLGCVRSKWWADRLSDDRPGFEFPARGGAAARGRPRRCA
jgi:hypothetical protein